MPYKPMDEREYRKRINNIGWSLKKGGIDYSLFDEKGGFVCSIKITHGRNTKGGEVVPHSVQKTEKKLKERGIQQWSQKKK